MESSSLLAVRHSNADSVHDNAECTDCIEHLMTLHPGESTHYVLVLQSRRFCGLNSSPTPMVSSLWNHYSGELDLTKELPPRSSIAAFFSSNEHALQHM
jgi:hypothetical protein